MRKVSIEVKTIYSIRFNLDDFTIIFENAKNDPTRVNEFENFCLEDDSAENIRECFESLGKLFSKDTNKNLAYIVRKLGFDGIENYGGFHGNDKTEYCISVYNRGADI